MPPTVPETRHAMIDFFALRRGPWAAAAAQLGFSAQDVAEFTQLLQEAEQAQAEAYKARNAARAAMHGANTRAEALRRKGAALIGVIRATAARTGDNHVYAAGQIPPPPPKPPRPAPEPPRNMRAIMDSSGATILTWEASTAGGVTFLVSRQLAGEDRPRLIGSTGEKRFIDSTVPAGTTQAHYLVRARRGRKENLRVSSTFIRYGALPRTQGAKAAA